MYTLCFKNSKNNIPKYDPIQQQKNAAKTVGHT